MAAGVDGRRKMLKEDHPDCQSQPRKPLCARNAYSCNKLFLFLYTLLFVFVGTGLLILGVWAEIERRQYSFLNNYLSIPVALTLFVGLFIFVNSIVGLIGTLQENILLLKVYLGVTVIAFFAQMSIGVLAFLFRNEVFISMKASDFEDTVKLYTQNPNLRDNVDLLQSNMKCCGFSKYLDYENNDNFSCASKSPQACGVPSSCCKPLEGVKLTKNCGYGIKRNVTMMKLGISNRIFTDGCIKHFQVWVMCHLDIVGSFGLGSSIPQIIGVLLAYYFIRKVEEYRVWYRVGTADSMSTS